MTTSGTTFQLVTPTETVQIKTKLIGMFNVYNTLAAVGACLVSNIPLATIVEAIAHMEGVPGRFEVVDAGQPFTVIVDYAHTPDSLENVLQTIRQFAKKRVFVVVGCGGDRDRTKRPLMAQIAVQYSDVPIFTSDNPRSEDPMAILNDMKQGVTEDVVCIVDRKEAITYAIEQAEEGDVVLIAGKGHETYQIIGKDVLYFDDRVVAREAIQRRKDK